MQSIDFSLLEILIYCLHKEKICIGIYFSIVMKIRIDALVDVLIDVLILDP